MPPRGYTFRAPGHPLLQAVYFVLGGKLLEAEYAVVEERDEPDGRGR